MSDNKHGGARPKQREDDGRTNNGGARPGTGPKPRRFAVKLGDGFYVGRRDKDGNGIGMGEAWIVTEITRTHVIFTDHHTGDMIRLVR
jgi:hypothetical protein